MGILKLYGSIILACAFYFAIDNASAISLVDDTPIPKNLDSLAKEYNNTGVDYLLEGNHEMASELFVKSLRIRESIPNFPKDRLANGYLNLAILKQDMSYIDSALIYYRKAESILLSMDNPPSSTLGITYYAFGDCLTHKQDYKSAIAYIQNGIALLGQDSLANSFHLVLASIKLSTAYSRAGMFDYALEAAQNALSMSKRYNRVYYSNALSVMGVTYMGMKNYWNALEFFKNVEEEIISGDKWRPSNLMGLYSNLGTTHKYTGQYELANKYFLKGIRIAEESNSFSPQLGLLLRNYALFLNSMGDLDGAEKYFFKSLMFNSKHSTSQNFLDFSLTNFYSPLVAIQCFDGIGALFLERFVESGEKHFAHQSFKYFSKAISFMDEQRAGVLDDGDKMYIDETYHALYLNTINACFIFSDIIPKAVEFAFKVSSKAKAAVLNQALMKERGLKFSGIPKDIVSKESDIRQSVGALHELYYEEKSKPAPSVKHLQSIERRIFDAQREYNELVTDIERKYPEYFSLRYDTTSVSVKNIQSKLKQSQILIDYIIIDSSLISFAVTPTEFQWKYSKLTDKFFNSFEALLQEVNPPTFDELNRANLETFSEVSSYLYKVLLEPFEQIIRGRELIIVPHLHLSAIPFAALTEHRVENPRGYYSLPYVVQSNSVSYSPSTKLFYTNQTARRSCSIRSISFAPSYENNTTAQSTLIPYRQGLGDLPVAEREAVLLGEMLKGDVVIGSKATENHFKKVAHKYNLLHLAMHTHIDEENPLYSKLIFANSIDSVEDGFLNTYEIYELNLNAKLVIISACRSGDGSMVRGEGLLSIARSFQYVGAQSLIAAQWRVEDYSGSEVTAEFSRMITKGSSQNIALQKAQQKFLETADPLRSHPYFWASYQLIGYSGALVYPDWLKLSIWFASIAVVLFVAYFIARRVLVKRFKNS